LGLTKGMESDFTSCAAGKGHGSTRGGRGGDWRVGFGGAGLGCKEGKLSHSHFGGGRAENAYELRSEWREMIQEMGLFQLQRGRSRLRKKGRNRTVVDSKETGEVGGGRRQT